MVWFLLCTHTLVTGVFNDFLHIIILHSIGHIPEVSTIRQSILYGRVWHIRHELFVLGENWPEFFHTQLLVVRHVYILNFAELEQMLLLGEHFLEEIFVDHFRRRYIQLNYTEYEQ